MTPDPTPADRRDDPVRSGELLARFGSARRPARPVVHARPEGTDDATVSAVGQLSAAFEVIENARGMLYAFHRMSGEADLAAVLADVAQTLEPMAQQAGVTLSLTGEDTPAVVRGDHDELAQVFQNLVQNAIKYGRKGGTATSDEGTVSHDNPVWVAFARAMGPMMRLPAWIFTSRRLSR